MTGTRTATAQRFLVTGTVQGVGFRPFVYRTAVQHRLAGRVRNTPEGVEITVTGESSSIASFRTAIIAEAPRAAEIGSVIVMDAPAGAADFETFEILESGADGRRTAAVPRDLATCPDCLAEMRDPANRRYRYPFTNCTQCGPRYSIMRSLPYDRPATTMSTFDMCPECRREYRDPADRRFHAQPNACPVCGPHLSLRDRRGRHIADREDALQEAVQCLRNGGIIAVKGLGGYHLMTNACSDRAVRRLRARKQREEKPFAVMMPDLATARCFAAIPDAAAAWLTGPAAPILLAAKREQPEGSLHLPLSACIAPGNPRLGVFLPYTPLHHLLTGEFGGPLVATSGNLSDEPICIEEHEALERLGGIADFFLDHNRPIAHPVDDSVMMMADDGPLFIRCARGLAPMAFDLTGKGGDRTTLAVGAHMKSTFTIACGGRFTVSPHIGDLETIPAWESFERNLETLQALYEVQPAGAVCDLHPDYATTRFAQRRFGKVRTVQHHAAHIYAVMAEHGIDGPVTGFAWDGTGFGDDGTIWGGEVLAVGPNGYDRITHLRPFPLPGGDSAAREPRRAALGLLHEIGLTGSMHPDAFSGRETNLLRRAIDRNINTVRTSSMGRLFDAAASLLGIRQAATYEGQAAMLVQACAESGPADALPYGDGMKAALDWEPMIRAMLLDRDRGVPAAAIARRFHETLAASITAIALRTPDRPVVLAGGCFQNLLLLQRSVARLRAAGLSVFRPVRLPPGDGAISFGQAAAAFMEVPS